MKLNWSWVALLEGLKAWRPEGLKAWRFAGLKAPRPEGLKSGRLEGSKAWRPKVLKASGLQAFTKTTFPSFQNHVPTVFLTFSRKKDFPWRSGELMTWKVQPKKPLWIIGSWSWIQGLRGWGKQHFIHFVHFIHVHFVHFWNTLYTSYVIHTREKGKLGEARGKMERVGALVWDRIPLGNQADTYARARKDTKRNETVSRLDSP